MTEGAVVHRESVAYHKGLNRQVPRRQSAGLNGKLD